MLRGHIAETPEINFFIGLQPTEWLFFMTKPLTLAHKNYFEEVRKQLTVIGHKEPNFIKVELLFYEVIAIAREYGNDASCNNLLAAINELQANQYQQTQSLYKKSSQREAAIRKFSSQLKSLLSAAGKNQFFSPPVSQP